MENNRMRELRKNQVEQIKMTEICNGTVIGIFSLWVVWVSTSLLIRIIQ